MNKSKKKEASRAIRNKDYSYAIELYKDALKENEKDEDALMLISYCYEWKGDLEKASSFADKYFEFDPSNFQMLSLALRYASQENDRQKMYQLACQFLENPPSQLQAPSSWMYWLFSPITFLLKIIGVNAKKDLQHFLTENNQALNETRAWAKQYKTYYEANT
jgi:tetratricopeptide (TPR) repeat protein